MIHAPTQGYANESAQLDEWGNQIVDEVQPIESDIILNVVRTAQSALEGTDLGSIIKDRDIQSVILLGFFSDVCIIETAVDLRDEFPDLSITVCNDGTASPKERHLSSIKVRYVVLCWLLNYLYLYNNFILHLSLSSYVSIHT